MIVVKKEDQAKMAILAVALIVVLAFSGYRMYSLLGPKGGTSDVVNQPVTQAAQPTTVASATPEIRLPYAELPAPNEPNPFRQILDDHRGGIKSMPLAEVNGGLSPMPVGDVDVKVVELPPLRLDGVLAGRAYAAIVTMGDRTDVLAIGGSMGEYTLMRVDARTATFSCKRGPVRLLVGEETKAPTPPPAPMKIAALPMIG